MSIYTRCIVVLLVVSSAALAAASPDKTPVVAPAQSSALDPAMDMSQVIALLQQQQNELVEQRKLLQSQAQQIKSLKDELDVLRTPTPALAATQETAPNSQ